LFARKSDIALQSVQVNEVLANAFEIFSQQLKVRGITVEWDLCPDLPKVQADPQRLEQVFINLLLNARDAIEDKRQEVGMADQQDIITIASKVENDRVVCSICDSGVGISDSLRERIFEPFFTTKEVGKGTGLGLSISYGIVKECRGMIRCRPNIGQGTCFEVSFPATKGDSET
jgi:histidine kinase